MGARRMAARNKGTVGVIGLGIMGGSFAKNLVASGWRVVGYDVDAARNRKLAKAGVEIASDVAALAKAVPTIITSLPSPKALDTVVAAIAGAKLPSKAAVGASTLTLAGKGRGARSLRQGARPPAPPPAHR